MAKFCCKDAVEHFLEFVEGSLCPDSKGEMSQHMQQCPVCTRLLESYKKTASLCGQVLRKAAPAGTVDQLLNSIRERLQKK